MKFADKLMDVVVDDRKIFQLRMEVSLFKDFLDFNFFSMVFGDDHMI